MLFLDDARLKNFTSCFKEKKFLAFFFKRLKINTTGAYLPDFPYVSPCGPEINYVRCDDRPIVFTGVTPGKAGEDLLMYGHAGDLLTVNFQPEKLCMFPHSGRVYHPAMEKVGGVGLVKSSLAIELSKLFLFDDGESSPPTHFVWKNNKIKLTNELFSLIKKEELEKKVISK